MFKIEKIAAFALAAAPMLLGSVQCFLMFGEPEIPAKYKNSS